MTTLFVIGCIILLFGAVVFRGAPYVPTHRRTIEAALDVIDLKEGDVVVDLGSGDGAFLKAAAERGFKAVGYEINPVLCIIAWLRCWAHRDKVKIYLRDYWLSDFPPDTKAVFVFLAGPYMNRLKRKLDREMGKRKAPLKLLSNGFAVPGMLPKKIVQGVYLYEVKG